MYSIASYKDLILEIEMSKTRIETIIEQKEILIKMMYVNAPTEVQAMVYSDMPKGSGKASISLERIYEGIARLEHMLEIEERILVSMQSAENILNDKLKRLEGIDYKVAYLIQVKRYTVQEVADELGYSFNYIQNLSAKVNKRCS